MNTAGNMTARAGVGPMSPLEIRMRRPLRGPEGHEAGGGTGVESGNQGEGGTTGAQPKDNTGGMVDAATFWQPDETQKEPVATPDPTLTNQGNGQPNPMQGILDRVKATKAGAIIDRDVIGEFGEMKFDKFTERMDQFAQQQQEAAVTNTTDILKLVIPQVFSQVERMLSEKFEGRDKNDFLESNISIAKDPGMRPIVQAVFDQALAKNKGDRTKAVAQTKQMLTAMRAGINTEIPLDEPPVNPNGSLRNPKNNVDWMDELGLTDLMSRS